jgi:soluble lytic murein transglycosylase-like protein
LDSDDRYDSLIAYYAHKHGRDPRQVKRQLRIESAFDPDARNKTSGAMGLAQFMPRTWLEWHDGTPGIQDMPPDNSPYNPEKAVAASCSYMRWLQQQLGNLRDSLAAYHCGIGRFRSAKPLPNATLSYIRKCSNYETETLCVVEPLFVAGAGNAKARA